MLAGSVDMCAKGRALIGEWRRGGGGLPGKSRPRSVCAQAVDCGESTQLRPSYDRWAATSAVGTLWEPDFWDLGPGCCLPWGHHFSPEVE